MRGRGNRRSMAEDHAGPRRRMNCNSSVKTDDSINKLKLSRSFKIYEFINNDALVWSWYGVKKRDVSSNVKGVRCFRL